MNTLEEKLQHDLVEAIKTKDSARISAIRSVKTAIQVEKTAGSYHELIDSDILKLIQKLSKQRAESIEIYTQTGRTELANQETAEKVVLDSYLPKILEVTELMEVINTIIKSINATSIKDMGRVMKELSTNYSGQFDGKTASTIIKEVLT